MKLRTIVGDPERHEIEVEQGWLGQRKVTVDGDDIIDKWALISFNETQRFTVGEQERHEMRVKFSRGLSGLKIDIYCDDKLLAKS